MSLSDRLLRKAAKMRSDPRNIMMTGLHAWVYVVNSREFRSYFTIGSKLCITEAEARSLKIQFINRYEGRLK